MTDPLADPLPDPLADPPSTAAPRAVSSIWPAVVICLFAVAVIWAGQNYSPISRRFPTVVGGALLGLGLMDLWGRTAMPGSDAVRAFWGSDFERREMTHNPDFRSEIAVVAWVLGAFAGMALFGILIALPVFCVAFVGFRARRGWRLALLAGASVLIFEAAVFEWLLEYTLYRGLLFSEGGLSAW